MPLTDRELAIAATEAGAAVVRARHGSVLDRFEKSPGDFATAADLEAEQTILDVLRDARPDDAVIAEESGRTGAAADRTWLVDPLCGTLNYAAGTTLVAVNVALRAGPGIAVAASADPFTGEVFWTQGSDAYVRRDGVDTILTPSTESRLVDVNIDPPFPNSPAFRAVRLLVQDEFVSRLRARVSSTSLALVWVAAGRRAAYVTDGDMRDNVHLSSGIALCQAAGCVVSGIQGQPLYAGAGGLIAAADQATQARLLDLVAIQLPPMAGP